MLAQSQARRLSICTSTNFSASGECIWTWEQEPGRARPTRLAQACRLSDHLLTTMITSVPQPLVTRQLFVLPASHTLYSPAVRGDQSISPSQGAADKAHALTKMQAPSEEVSRAGACHDLQKVPPRHDQVGHGVSQYQIRSTLQAPPPPRRKPSYTEDVTPFPPPPFNFAKAAAPNIQANVTLMSFPR